MEKVREPSISTIHGSIQHLIGVSKRKRVWKQKNKKVILILVPALGIIAIVFVVLFAIEKTNYDKLLKTKVCTSEDCIATAKTLMETMDTSKDPCTDFYAYACGHFGVEHPLPDGAVYRSWFEEGEEKLSRMVQSTVESGQNLNSMKTLKKAKDFYASCIDTTKLEELKLTPLYKMLQLLGLPKFPSKKSAKSFNLGKTLGLLQRHLNMDIIVQVGFEKGAIRKGANNDTFILQVSPVQQLPQSSLHFSPLPAGFDPEIIRSDSSTSNIPSAMSPQQLLELRLIFMANIMKIIRSDVEGTTAERNETDNEMVTQAFKILTFTLTLNEEISNDSNDTSKEVELMTFSELQSQIDFTLNETENGNKILWRDYLDGLFYGDQGYWTYDYDQDLVSVRTVKLFQALASFLASTQAITIERYVWWTVVSEYVRYTTEEVDMVYKKLHEAVLGKEVATTRQKICVGYVRKFFPLALAKEIRTVFAFTENTTKISEMLEDIVDEFEVLVDSVTWMDRHTKDLNIAKAKAVKNIIGYDDTILNDRLVDEYYEDLYVNKAEFLMNMAAQRSWDLRKTIRILKQSNESLFGPLADVTNPLQVNAYYARTSNAIYVPAGILQRPFYYRGLESLNYGAIGSILGHELTHGFDSDGKNYDREGKIRKQIWSPEITEEFSHRAKCFVDQYGNFDLTKQMRLDGEFTLAENIADNGGIRESYYAYQTYIKRHGSEPKLPGFENFTHEQLLFLSFATIWCETSTERYRELASRDNHSPNRVRVLASLQNMQPFSDAFHCPVGSFMNPRNKCIIW